MAKKCKERKNAQITSMNHMLWQLEIHAKPIIEHMHEDTHYKICGHTKSLKLRACFHIQIKSAFWCKSMQKHLSPFGIWESPSLFLSLIFFSKTLFSCFDLQNFQRVLVVDSFKNMLGSRNEMVWVPETVIIYDYTIRTSKFAN